MDKKHLFMTAYTVSMYKHNIEVDKFTNIGYEEPNMYWCILGLEGSWGRVVAEANLVWPGRTF